VTDEAHLFGAPLQADPAVALPPAPATPDRPGPLHKVQFVVELVGDRTVPAGRVASLLSPEWRAALGEPEAFAMAPSDDRWRPLAAATQGSYDSVALCWDFHSERGSLNQTSAQRLLDSAAQFAASIGRKAVPLPHPNDVDAHVQGLAEIQGGLDAGFAVAVVPRSGSIEERELWMACANLGLDLASDGTFQWRAGDSDEPMFSVSPLAQGIQFSLESVARKVRHEGAGLGFRAARAPDPARAFEGCLRAAEHLADRFDAFLVDEEGSLLTPQTADEHREGLAQLLRALDEVGIPAGSPEARRLFI
jgi:hypothetical protein